jgi:hypothetical protein
MKLATKAPRHEGNNTQINADRLGFFVVTIQPFNNLTIQLIRRIFIQFLLSLPV